jgi:hypothetical protein
LWFRFLGVASFLVDFLPIARVLPWIGLDRSGKALHRFLLVF